MSNLRNMKRNDLQALEIKEFFLNISQRMRNENDLSDITWAMTQTSDKFLTEFLRFFFPKDEFDDIELIREYAQGNNRPDFYFKSGKDVYLIECKIWDDHQHFDDYIKEFGIPHKRLGYITNYTLNKPGFTVKTWTELYKYLKNQIPPEEAPLWNGYLVYLQKVCNIYIPTKPMNTKGMYSLYEFYNCLDSVISQDTSIFSSRPYEKNDMQETYYGGNRKHGKPNNGLMGKYFQIDFKGKGMPKTSCGWMGVYFHKEQPEICIGFSNEDGWGLPVYKKLKPALNHICKGIRYEDPYEEEGAIWFDFASTEVFDKMKKPELQIELLSSYFSEVMENIAHYITR